MKKDVVSPNPLRKKIHVNRQTVRVLSNRDLDVVAAGECANTSGNSRALPDRTTC